MACKSQPCWSLLTAPPPERPPPRFAANIRCVPAAAIPPLIDAARCLPRHDAAKGAAGVVARHERLAQALDQLDIELVRTARHGTARTRRMV
jgi:hypothetical protein